MLGLSSDPAQCGTEEMLYKYCLADGNKSKNNKYVISFVEHFLV